MGRYDRERDFVISLVRELGEIQLQNFGNVLKLSKQEEQRPKKNAYSITDIKCQGRAIALIKKRFPRAAVFAEEDTPDLLRYAERNDANKECWVLDPLDGSYNYTENKPFFGVVAGFRLHNLFAVGAMYLPKPGTLYLAVEGEGVRKFTNNDLSVGSELRIPSGPEAPQMRDLIHLGGGIDKPERPATRILNDKSGGIVFHHEDEFSSIDRTVDVLEGKYKGYLRYQSSIYGAGPEGFVIQNAGGAFIGLDHKPPHWVNRRKQPAHGKARFVPELESYAILGPQQYSQSLADMISGILTTYNLR